MAFLGGWDYPLIYVYIYDLSGQGDESYLYPFDALKFRRTEPAAVSHTCGCAYSTTVVLSVFCNRFEISSVTPNTIIYGHLKILRIAEKDCPRLGLRSEKMPVASLHQPSLLLSSIDPQRAFIVRVIV